MTTARARQVIAPRRNPLFLALLRFFKAKPKLQNLAVTQSKVSAVLLDSTLRVYRVSRVAGALSMFGRAVNLRIPEFRQAGIAPGPWPRENRKHPHAERVMTQQLTEFSSAELSASLAVGLAGKPG